jgi:hypothetical protein
MSLRIFNKTNAHYWDKKKTDWAVQDKDGFWWIVPGSEMAENKLDKTKKMNIPSRKKMRQSSMMATPDRMILIIVSALLGISLGINVVYYLMR